MLLETDLVAEGLAAHGAGEGPAALAAVVRAPRVHLEAVRRREDLGALQARVDATAIANEAAPIKCAVIRDSAVRATFYQELIFKMRRSSKL